MTAAYGVSRTGAQAMLDMQCRRFTVADRARIEDEHASLREQLGLLPE